MRSKSRRLHFKDLMAFARKATTESGDSSAEFDPYNNAASSAKDDVDDDGCEGVIASVQELHDNDVLCGRDKTSHAHPGNRRFRKIVESYRENYQNASSREEKTRITGKVVEVIRGGTPPGRFLKFDEKLEKYFDVGDKYAHEKVSHALRSAKDPNRVKPKRIRTVPKRELTATEHEMCERVYEEQQKIFRALVEKSTESNGAFDGVDEDELKYDYLPN